MDTLYQLAANSCMNEEQSLRNLLVGAGGIGTQLAELLVAALRRVNLQGTITLMDADVVEASNLGHQRYTAEDIGREGSGAGIPTRRPRFQPPRQGVVNNLRSADQFDGHDLVVVCVTDPNLDASSVPSRSRGLMFAAAATDGWCCRRPQSRPSRRMTPDHEPTSCQVAGALEAGNLEFGFAVAAAFGAQWALQQ